MYFYCHFFFFGQIIYNIGGLCRIAPPNFATLLRIVQSDVRGGSNKPGREQQRKHGAHALSSVLSSRPLQLKNLLPELTYHQNRAWRLANSGPKSTRNDCDNAIRCTWRLQHTLGEANNASMERKHTPGFFQVALFR